MLFGEFCEIFKNIFFTEHLRTTACPGLTLSYVGQTVWLLSTLSTDCFAILESYKNYFRLKMQKF